MNSLRKAIIWFCFNVLDRIPRYGRQYKLLGYDEETGDFQISKAEWYWSWHGHWGLRLVLGWPWLEKGLIWEEVSEPEEEVDVR